MTEHCCDPSDAETLACQPAAPAAGSARPPAGRCPECGAAGKPVDLQTVKALLAVSLRDVRETGYRFCRTATCPVVYYSLDGSQTFHTTDLREQVYHKAPDADGVFVCYCFRHTVGALRAADAQGRAALAADVQEGVRAGQCACELRNPQGTCCLGNVRELIKRLDAGEAVPESSDRGDGFR